MLFQFNFIVVHVLCTEDVFNPTELGVFKHIISHIRPNHLSGYAPVPMWPDNRGRTVLNFIAVHVLCTDDNKLESYTNGCVKF